MREAIDLLCISRKCFVFHSELNIDAGGTDDHLEQTDMVHDGHDLLPSSGKDARTTDDLVIHRLACSHAKEDVNDRSSY
jgi:hypothetical protein